MSRRYRDPWDEPSGSTARSRLRLIALPQLATVARPVRPPDYPPPAPPGLPPNVIWLPARRAQKARSGRPGDGPRADE